MSDEYQGQLGDRLRAIRNQQGLTLADVEEKSFGEWKAVVVGSYERGDRAISVTKLARLADFYGVPVHDLLPDRAPTDVSTGGRVVLDLTALEADADAEGPVGAVSRFARRIQIERGDYNGRMLSLRTDDLRAVAIASGVEPDELLEMLEERGAVLAV